MCISEFVWLRETVHVLFFCFFFSLLGEEAQQNSNPDWIIFCCQQATSRDVNKVIGIELLYFNAPFQQLCLTLSLRRKKKTNKQTKQKNCSQTRLFARQQKFSEASKSSAASQQGLMLHVESVRTTTDFWSPTALQDFLRNRLDGIYTDTANKIKKKKKTYEVCSCDIALRVRLF